VAIRAVAVTCRVDVGSRSVDFGVDDETRSVDFVISTADSAALVVDLDEVGDGHFTEMHGVWDDPEGVRIDWICGSVRVVGRNDSIRKKELETRNNYMVKVIVEGPPLEIVDSPRKLICPLAPSAYPIFAKIWKAAAICSFAISALLTL
jgi:hypothetical protein